MDPGAVKALIGDGRIPVISSVARSEQADVLNVNADTAAAALAVALGAVKLIVLTDVAGLYADWPGTAPARRPRPAAAGDQRADRERPGRDAAWRSATA